MTDVSIINRKTTGLRPAGYTTLHLVSDSSDRGYGRRGLVQGLVNSGAELEATDPNGNTAFLLASGVGVTDVIDTLITLGANVFAKNLKGMGAMQKALHHSSDVRTALSNAHVPDTYAPHTGRAWAQMAPQRKARLCRAFHDPHYWSWRLEGGWQDPHCPDRWQDP